MYAMYSRLATESPQGESNLPHDLHWMIFAVAVGLLALGAAWFGGEHFILRQVRILSHAAKKFAGGDFQSRTGLADEHTEFGDLARTFDSMAESLQQRGLEREQAEKTLLNRSFQQTVVSALGQFALVTNDRTALFDQAAMLVAQNLELEYCCILELQPDDQSFRLCAGVGWNSGTVDQLVVSADPATQFGFTLRAGDPIVFDQLSNETRFEVSPLLLEHGVVSGATIAISGHGRAFGILGAYTTNRRQFTEDEVHFLMAVATLLAMAVERNLAEAQLQKLAAFAQLNPNPAMELAANGALTYFNDAVLRLSLSVGQNSPRGILPPDILTIVRSCLATGESKRRFETKVEGRTFSWSFHPVPASEVVHAYVEDITERLNLEAQLRQSQKMESVGQLAAGVAHDFNNMLTVIQGHAGMMLDKPGLPPQLTEPTQAIYLAAERAAGLTRQLLMFSRKNVMQPKLLDLRDIVIQMSKMFQRLLGETIALEFLPPAVIPLVEADEGMVEQVIMNLAVNARDAMPNGGKLTIFTEAVLIDDAYVQTHPEARTGFFVCLRVTDVGHGMDAATLARIFEPFFTTKEVGKGTGLGLATVYGIVKQHEGWIEVLSQPGKGTTFCVFFPASTAPVPTKSRDAAPAPTVCRGKETILIVEDEPFLREMAHAILEDCGYRILEAASGRQALEIWSGFPEHVDLLLTDMVMPEGVSGMELAQKLLVFKPKLRVVFASGYSIEDLNQEFVHRSNAVFLQKPYTHITLTQAVRKALDSSKATADI
jgi:signal transduction histidine kinase/ActR/RegA family two-component response regulator/HAMP domain-containing protein